jgi:EmrB/QacA subfamily drug resistance transporter
MEPKIPRGNKLMPNMTRRKVRLQTRTAAHAAEPPAEVSSPPPDPRRWLVLAVVLMASFLGALDFFIVNVSIPSIKARLGASFAEIQLMIAGYGLVYAVFLITGGRLGDIFGRKRMFLVGVAGFTLASALCGLAPSPAFLIAARVVQGLTGALMFPQVLSIIQVSFPPEERVRAFAIFGMAMGTASFSGNVLGGLLVEADLFGLGWRPIFLVNLPLGVLALLAGYKLIRESRSERAVRLDVGGVGIATVGLFLLVFPLVQGREAGWPAWAFGCLAASLPVLAVFLWYERRVSARGGSPLLELALFRNRAFTAGLATTLAFYGGLSAFFLSFTLFLQEGLKFTPLKAGLTFAPFALGFLTSSTLAVKLAARLGRRIIQLGAAVMATALAAAIGIALGLGAGVTSLHLLPVLFVYGAGQGLVMPTLVSTVLGGVPTSDAGSASGVLTTVQQVALALGVAAIGSVYFAVLGSQPGPADFSRAVGTALVFNIVLLLATCGLVFLLPDSPTAQVRAATAEI